MSNPPKSYTEGVREWLKRVADSHESARAAAFAIWGEGNESARSRFVKVLSGTIRAIDVELVADVERYVEAHRPQLARVAPADSSGDLDITVRTAIRAGAASPGWRLAEGDEHEQERWRVIRQRMYELIGVWLEPGDEAICIEGWSMKRPGAGLDSGQLVLYRPTDHLTSGERFVVQMENLDVEEHLLLCKRVQVFSDSSVRLISDNRSPGFMDENLLRVKGTDHLQHAETGARVRLHIIGRVLWPRDDDDEREVRVALRALQAFRDQGGAEPPALAA